MTDLARGRAAFEQWYAENAFDYAANPIGSRDCGLQWAAWQAAAERTARLEEALRPLALHVEINRPKDGSDVDIIEAELVDVARRALAGEPK